MGRVSRSTSNGSPAPEIRHRAVIGTQLRTSDWDHANGVVDRAGPDVKAVLEGRKPSPITAGYVMGVMAHNECRQREADQEAENQRTGDYAPVFLKPNLQPVDIGFYEGRKPPKLERDYMPIASLSESCAVDDDSKATLVDIIADGSAARSEERAAVEVQLCGLEAAIDALKPDLSQKELVVLDDWLLGSKSITEIA